MIYDFYRVLLMLLAFSSLLYMWNFIYHIVFTNQNEISKEEWNNNNEEQNFNVKFIYYTFPSTWFS